MGTNAIDNVLVSDTCRLGGNQEISNELVSGGATGTQQ